MTHKEMTKEIAVNLGWTEEKTVKVLNDFVNLVNNKLSNHTTTIFIEKLGTFRTIKNNERIIKDTKSEKQYLIPPQINIHFEPASILIEKIKNAPS